LGDEDFNVTTDALAVAVIMRVVCVM